MQRIDGGTVVTLTCALVGPNPAFAVPLPRLGKWRIPRYIGCQPGVGPSCGEGTLLLAHKSLTAVRMFADTLSFTPPLIPADGQPQAAYVGFCERARKIIFCRPNRANLVVIAVAGSTSRRDFIVRNERLTSCEFAPDDVGGQRLLGENSPLEKLLKSAVSDGGKSPSKPRTKLTESLEELPINDVNCIGLEQGCIVAKKDFTGENPGADNNNDNGFDRAAVAGMRAAGEKNAAGGSLVAIHLRAAHTSTAKGLSMYLHSELIQKRAAWKRHGIKDTAPDLVLNQDELKDGNVRTAQELPLTRSELQDILDNVEEGTCLY